MGQITEHWTPNEADMVAGSRAYVAYAMGVAILHNPSEVVATMISPQVDRVNEERLIAGAERLMWNGLERVIRLSNPPTLRSNISNMEHRHAEAYPHTEKIINRACDAHQSPENYGRLETLHPLFTVFPPNPLEDDKIYRFIAHNRKNKIPTLSLMGGYAVHERWTEIMEGRMIAASLSRGSGGEVPASRLLKLVANE